MSRARDLVIKAVSDRARSRRLDALLMQFPDLGRYRVLDLGGRVDTWHHAPVRPAHVTVVNLAQELVYSGEQWASLLAGDACDDGLLAGEEFDLVFSNSLLEHVGGHVRRMQCAATVRRLAPRWWVQTPYRHFPVEPHFLCPGMQYLPTAGRIRVAQVWPLAHAGRLRDEGAAAEAVLDIELLDTKQFVLLFPDSTVLRERFAGLTKSLIALKT